MLVNLSMALLNLHVYTRVQEGEVRFEQNAAEGGWS